MLKICRTLMMLAVISLSAVLSAKADAVSDWNVIAVQATVTAGASRPGPSGVIDIAMVHAAIYDAVQAYERKYQPYYVDIQGATGSPSAATAKAARDVLVNRFPAQTAAIDAAYQNYLMTNGISPSDPGIGVGAQAAAGILALRACDGSFPSPAPPPFIGGTGIGQWRPTPPANSVMNPGPWLGQVAPFLMTRSFQFRSDPPPPLFSEQYRRDYNEVKALGALTGSTRTPAQTDQAQFWAGNFGVMLNKMVRDLSAQHVTNIDDSSRLFALTTMAMADAIISVWNDKAHHNFWRPITAIQNGDADGNPNTIGDPTWNSLIAAPPYPDHTSGANGITAAATRAVENYFQTDLMKIAITTTNTGPTSQDTRDFDRFSDVRQEVVDARILLGIHFRFADEGSRKLGIRVADYGYRNYLRPKGEKDEHDVFVSESLFPVRGK